MGWLFGNKKKVISTGVHCGICGFTLDRTEWLCPACGGIPVCDRCGSEIRKRRCPKGCLDAGDDE